MFEVLNGCVCAIIVLVALRRIARQPGALFPYLGIIFVGTNVLGLSFLRMPAVADMMWYGRFFELEEGNVQTQFLAAWVFTGVVLLGLLYSPRERAVPILMAISRERSLLLVVLLFTVSTLLYSRFMFYGQNYKYALDTSFLTRSFEEMARARHEVSSAKETGQGFLMASVSAQVGFPLAAALALAFRYCSKRDSKN